jgi:Ca2+/Na+ antiporter
MFIALAIVCDEFFVPALEVMAQKLGMTEDVAGATLMAAGGSAPELFTSFFGVFVAESNVGIGTIVGSAVFNVLFVIAMCGIFAKKVFVVLFLSCQFFGRSFCPSFSANKRSRLQVLALTWFPLARDCTFYVIDLVVLAVFFSDKEIQWYESLTLIVLYGAYVAFIMIANGPVEKWARHQVNSRKKEHKEIKFHVGALQFMLGALTIPDDGVTTDVEILDVDSSQDPKLELSSGPTHSDNEPEDEEEKPLSLKWPEGIRPRITCELTCEVPPSVAVISSFVVC